MKILAYLLFAGFEFYLVSIGAPLAAVVFLAAWGAGRASSRRQN